MHTNAQANSHGADLFKQCHHSHLGHRRKYGVGSKQSQKSVNGHRGLGEEGWLRAQALGAPRAIPGPLPTADPAPPSRSHPQHNHTTTHHPATPHNRPAPPATLPQTAPPSTYGRSEENPPHLLPSCAGVSPAQLHPWEAEPEANPFLCWNSLHTPSPTGPQCCLAEGQAAAHQSPRSPGLPPRDCRQSGSESQGCRVCSPPCSEPVEALRARERKGSPAPTPTYFDPFSCPLKPCPTSPKASLSLELDSAVFQSPRQALLLGVPPWDAACMLPDASCSRKENTGPPTSPKALQSRRDLLPDGRCPREMCACQLPSPFWICYEKSAG